MKRHRNQSSHDRSGNRSQNQPRDPRTGEFESRNRGYGMSYGQQGYGSQGYGSSSQGGYQGGGWGSEGQGRWSGQGSGSQSGYGSQSWGSEGGGGYGEMNWENEGEGRHFGKGPKGYTRSDERIKEEISDELTEHGGIDASNCTVRVENGEVTLEGEVEDREQKRMIEDLAEQCSGVKQVHNRLRVAKGEGSSRSTGSSYSGATEGSESSTGGRKGSSSSQRS